MQKIDWTKEYRRLSGEVFHITLRYVRNRAEAEDLVQEVFLTAMEKADSFQGRGAWDGWIYRLAVNHALQHLRKQNKVEMQALAEGKEFVDTAEVSLPEEESRPGKEASSFQKRLTIAKADFSEEQMLDVIHSLTGPHQMVFNLYVMDGFSHKEIAQNLGIPESTSKSYLLRARKKVQDKLYILALDMKKKQNSRSALWLLWLLLMGSGGQIKAQYRRSIKDLPLPTATPSSDFSHTLSQNAGQLVHSSWSSLQLLAVGAVSGAALGGAAVEGAHYLFEAQEPQEITVPEPSAADTVYVYPSAMQSPSEEMTFTDEETPETSSANSSNDNNTPLYTPTKATAPSAKRDLSKPTTTAPSPSGKASPTKRDRSNATQTTTTASSSQPSNAHHSAKAPAESKSTRPSPSSTAPTTLTKLEKAKEQNPSTPALFPAEGSQNSTSKSVNHTSKSKDSHPLVKPAPVVQRKVVFDTVYIEP